MSNSKTWRQPVKQQTPQPSDEEKRINVLFSPFRKRELNPIDYDSKLNYWKEAIQKLCEDKKSPAFTISSLQKDFSRNNKSPSCIPTVLDELTKAGDIMDLDTFWKMTPERTWGSWIVSSLVVTPAVWSFSKLMDALMEKEVTTDNHFVSVRYIKKIALDVIQRAEKEYRSIMAKDEFIEFLSDFGFSDETINILLHWLKVERKVIIRNESEGRQLIKVGENVKTFSDTECVSLLLEDSRKRLVKTIETLEKEKKDCIELVRKQIREGSKLLAKSSLRRSKELEKCIAKKCSALDNLDSLIVRIQETNSDSEVFEAYKFGLSALKSKLNETGLDEDDVVNTMSEIQEITEMHDNIQSALSLPVSPSDETELEDELSAILNSNAQETPLNESIELNLPDVPSTPSPIKSEKKEKTADKLFA